MKIPKKKKKKRKENDQSYVLCILLEIKGKEI